MPWPNRVLMLSGKATQPASAAHSVQPTASPSRWKFSWSADAATATPAASALATASSTSGTKHSWSITSTSAPCCCQAEVITSAWADCRAPHGMSSRLVAAPSSCRLAPLLPKPQGPPSVSPALAGRLLLPSPLQSPPLLLPLLLHN